MLPYLDDPAIYPAATDCNERPAPRARSSAKPDVRPTVYVVDGDVSYRESLKRLIRRAGWQPETFASVCEFLSHPHVPRPSCVVLDIDLPGIDGLDLQRRVADRVDMPIIVITGDGSVSMAVRVMKAGAIEFLTKPFSDDVLLSAIRNAVEQSSAALRELEQTRALRNSYASLTRREREIMALVVAGLLNKQVAGELGISENTVKAHRGKMMRKMNARTLAGLVNMAARLGLAPVPMTCPPSSKARRTTAFAIPLPRRVTNQTQRVAEQIDVACARRYF